MKEKQARRQNRLSTLAGVRFFLKGNIMFFFGGMVIYLIESGAIILPSFFQQVYTDNIITRENPEWFTPLLVLYFTLFLLEMVAWISLTLLRKRYSARLGITMYSSYVWTVLRLSMTTLRRFTPAELVARYSSIFKVIRTLDFALPSIIMIIVPMLSCILLMIYNWKLGLLEVCSILLLVWMMYLTSNLQKKKAMGMEVKDANLWNTTVTGLDSLETIKSVGGESYFFAQWDKAYVEALNERVDSTSYAIFLGSVPQIVLQLTNATILCLGAWYILRGEMTPGMLLASQGLANTIILPVNKTIQGAMSIMRSQSAIERVKEVNDYDVNLPDLRIAADDELPEIGKLTGEIELRDVTFGYDRNLPPILKHFSLKIKPGESIGFVGPSGSGKSTVISLVSGLYEPWEGEVLFDGKPRSEINRMTFISSVATINQDITLFEGSVSENIKMWDDSIEDFAMVMASHFAQIHTEIMMRPGAYQGTVYENGKNFSGGQRQRIEIATALAKDPMIILMDEGTSALDPETEAKVMNNISSMGMTLLIVAHRLDTIRNCDQIYVIEQGHVVQHGTHEELMQMEGLYSRLIKSA